MRLLPPHTSIFSPVHTLLMDRVLALLEVAYLVLRPVRELATGVGEVAAGHPGAHVSPRAGPTELREHTGLDVAAYTQLKAFGLIRTDSAGGTHDFVAWLAQRGRWLSYSVGMVITEAIHQHVLKVPASAWTTARR